MVGVCVGNRVCQMHAYWKMHACDDDDDHDHDASCQYHCCCVYCKAHAYWKMQVGGYLPVP